MKKHLMLALLAGLTLLTVDAAAQDRPQTQLPEWKALAAKHNDATVAVATLRARMPQLDKQRRGRIATVGTMLDDIGPEGLAPMLVELLEDRPFDGMRDSVRRGWRIGLLFAVGRQRNPEARAVLEHVLRTEPDVEILTSASEALGKLQDDAATAVLVAEAQGNSPRALAILRGMGQCRRVSMANHLSSRIVNATGEELDATIEALRDVGNSWAWRTDVVAASGESEAVRQTVTTALLSAWRVHPDARNAIRKAVLIVDAAQAPELVDQMAADLKDADQSDYAKLRRSVLKNPLHRR